MTNSIYFSMFLASLFCEVEGGGGVVLVAAAYKF